MIILPQPPACRHYNWGPLHLALKFRKFLRKIILLSFQLFSDLIFQCFKYILKFNFNFDRILKVTKAPRKIYCWHMTKFIIDICNHSGIMNVINVTFDAVPWTCLQVLLTSCQFVSIVSLFISRINTISHLMFSCPIFFTSLGLGCSLVLSFLLPTLVNKWTGWSFWRMVSHLGLSAILSWLGLGYRSVVWITHQQNCILFIASLWEVYDVILSIIA